MSGEAGVEGRQEGAITLDGAHKIRLTVPVAAVVESALVVSLSYGVEASSLSDAGDTPVIVSHLYTPANALGDGVAGDEAVALLVVRMARDEVELTRTGELLRQISAIDRATLRSLRPVTQIFACSQTLSDEVGEDAHRVVGRHTARIVRGERPAWEDRPFVIVADEALAVAQCLIRVDDREQRMQRTIGIPDREDGVVTFFGAGILMDSLVHTTEATIDILIVEGSDMRVVECGVEVLEHCRVRGLDTDLAEEISPDTAALGAHSLEVPVGELCLHIALSTLGRDGGETDLHEVGRAPLGEIEVELQVSRVTLDGEACAESLTLTITIESDAIGRRGEAKDIAHLMMLCPALGVVGADDRRVIDEAEVIPHDLMPPVGLEDMTEVKEELTVCAVSIGSS